MISRYYCFVFLIFNFIIQNVAGQDLLDANLTHLIETMQEDFPEVAIDQEVLEELQEITEHRMPINSATRKDLLRLPFLSKQLIENIHYYLFVYGPMQSLYELKAVKGFNKELVLMILPFVTLYPSESVEQKQMSVSKPRNELLYRYSTIIEEESGFEKQQALGSPYSFLVKNKLSFKNLKWVVVAEKDIGEKYFFNKRPEFISSSFQYSGRKILKKMIIGDYKVNLGHGLIQSSNLFNRKSSLIIVPGNNSENLRISTSADGAWFKRGAAIQLKKNNFAGVFFGSYQKSDATIHLDAIRNQPYFISAQNGGLHRTQSEYKRRNTVKFREYGASIKYLARTFTLSLQGSYNGFNIFHKRRGLMYESWCNVSLSASGIKGQLNWWMESAMDKNSNASTIAGGDVFLHKSFGISFVGRYFSPDYHSYFGNVFSEGGKPSNEQGLYIGCILSPNGKINIRCYLDVFAFPEPTYNVSIPSSGWESFCQIEGALNENSSWIVKLKYEEKAKDGSDGTILKTLIRKKVDANFRLDYDVSGINFKSVVQVSDHNFNSKREWGWMFYQDVKGKLFNEKLSIGARAAFFNTSSYNTRLYAYEHDVLYAFTVPAYYGKGVRYIVNLNYKMNRSLSFYLKYGLTKYSDRDVISSGFTEISGDVKSELKIQLRYRL